MRHSLGVIALTAVTLGGCALQSTVKHVNARARQALVTSAQALATARREARARRKTEESLQAEVARLAANEKSLAYQLGIIRKARVALANVVSTKPPVDRAKIAANSLFQTVLSQASALATKPYKAPASIPMALRKLSFNDYNKIGYAGRLPGWPAGTPFHVNLYPSGYLFTWPVKINVVTKGQTVAARLPFVVNNDPHLAETIRGPVPTAGFSVYTPFVPGQGVDEFLSFLGASYFRAVGQGQSWGLSARGVAVNTALSHRAEEFPYFREFWLIAPTPHAHHLAFCGLLDSPSLTGAYRFVVHPGTDTVVNVKAVLFERHPVRRLGIAPLTSMFLQGRFSAHHYDKLIRSAHDSDGLEVQTGHNSQLWWPLRDPRRLTLYRFYLNNPQGFGLVQRARRAQDYRAFGMHYENRPTAWVTPENVWGAGHLLLVELPTDSQTNDNISVFWVPAHTSRPGQPLVFQYRITWSGHNSLGAKLALVVASRHAYKSTQHRETYVVDFRGERLAHLTATAVQPIVHVWGPAKVENVWVAKNGKGGRWRLQFTVVSTGSGVASIHASLASGASRLTETWADVFPLH